MVELIIICYIIYIVLKKKSNIFTNHKLNLLLKTQDFSNISMQTITNGIKIITANSRGENHMFALSNNQYILSTSDIDRIYEYAQKLHFHNIIIVVNSISFSSTTLKKIKEYGIQIWDNKKIDSLISSPGTAHILHTSDTSDDKCKIESNQPSPIQPYTPFWKDMFKRPNRL